MTGGDARAAVPSDICNTSTTKQTPSRANRRAASVAADAGACPVMRRGAGAETMGAGAGRVGKAQGRRGGSAHGAWERAFTVHQRMYRTQTMSNIMTTTVVSFLLFSFSVTN